MNRSKGLTPVPLRRTAELARNAPLASGAPLRAARLPLKAGNGNSKSAATRRSGTASGRGESAARNSGPTPEVRDLVLERDGYCCVCCGRSIIGQRYSLGHRLRASQGGKAVPSNLLTFLGWGGEGCHGRIDNREDPADEAKGYTVRSWQDPALIPVMVFSEHGSGVMAWPTDDGQWVFEAPAGAA